MCSFVIQEGRKGERGSREGVEYTRRVFMSQSQAAVRAQLPPSLQRLIVHGSPEEVFREGEKYFEAVVLGML